MRPLDVAIVGVDPALRQLAAEAFDRAPASWDVTIHDRAPDAADVIVQLDASATDRANVIGFDPARPEETVAAILALSNRRDGPIGVWSPCPGSGATSVALHLAACLAESAACVLVDLDPRRGAAVRIGCPPLDPDVTDPNLRTRPVAGGFRLLEGELPRPDASTLVVVDGRAEDVLGARCTKHVVVVPSGRSGVERSRSDLEALPGDAAVIVNRTGWGGELTRSGISQLLGRRVALELPFSPGLRDAEDRCELLRSPLSPWLSRVRRLARAL